MREALAGCPGWRLPAGHAARRQGQEPCSGLPLAPAARRIAAVRLLLGAAAGTLMSCQQQRRVR